MVLDASGRIMFIFTSRDRRKPTNDAERAGLVKDLMSYTGPIRLDGAGRFITTVDVAANPAIPRKQLRLFKIDGDRLTVATEAVRMTIAQGRPVVGDAVFLREHPATKP